MVHRLVLVAARYTRALLRVAPAMLAVRAGLLLLPADRLGRVVGVPLVISDSDPQEPVAWDDLPSQRQVELRMIKALLRRRPFRSASPCLQESLGIGIVFRHAEPRLRLGVGRQGADLRAHAWVEAGGGSFLADPSFLPLGDNSGDTGR